MFRQILHFVANRAVRVEVRAREEMGEVSLGLTYMPSQQGEEAVTLETPAQAAEFVERRVRDHLTRHNASLEQIVIQHDLAPITYTHLAALLEDD